MDEMAHFVFCITYFAEPLMRLTWRGYFEEEQIITLKNKF